MKQFQSARAYVSANLRSRVASSGPSEGPLHILLEECELLFDSIPWHLILYLLLSEDLRSCKPLVRWDRLPSRCVTVTNHLVESFIETKNMGLSSLGIITKHSNCYVYMFCLPYKNVVSSSEWVLEDGLGTAYKPTQKIKKLKSHPPSLLYILYRWKQRASGCVAACMCQWHKLCFTFKHTNTLIDIYIEYMYVCLSVCRYVCR
jgi:hypothetical protein